MVENRIVSSFEQATSVYKEEKAKLDDYLKDLGPEFSYQTGEAWRNYREHQLTKHGKDSILDYFPEYPEVNHHKLLRPLYALSRACHGTKEGLRNLNFNEIVYDDYGHYLTPKPMELGKILQDIAIAEQYVEWNSHKK